jgi:hypothetical protein
MKTPAFMAVLVLLASFGLAAAQTTGPCQIASVEASAKDTDKGPEAGTPVIFSAKLNTKVPTAKPEFSWQISAGTIRTGQGTDSITVDTDGLAGQTITATVSIAGVSTLCSTSATQTVGIANPGPICGLPFDEFGDISFNDEKARLDNFAISLVNYDGATGYIFVYAGKQSYESEAAERVLRAKNYLESTRGIAPVRIIAIDGGYREEFRVVLIIVPPGATPPISMPTLSPTEITLTKPRPKPVHKTSHKSRNK